MFDGQNEIRKREFPQFEKMIWLNSAGTVPIPKCSVKAMIDAINMHSDQPYDYKTGQEVWQELVLSAKKSAAKLMACRPEDFAYINNTSHGLQFPLHGIDWEKGDNVVTCDLEFPANYLPWKYIARRKSVELRVAKTRNNGQIDEQEIVELINDKTKLVALSLVQFCNGQRIDAETIGKVAHEHEALISLDGIQACGGVEVYPAKMDIDFLTAGGPKFLMSPVGVGICYISPRVVETMEPPLHGWINYDYSDGNYMNKNPPLREGAARFEHGTVPSYCIAGMNASIELINSVGIKTVARHNYSLTKMMIDAFKDAGFKVITPHSPEKRGALINVQLGEGKDPKKIVEILEEKHSIKISSRFNGLRLSTHLYNTEEEVQKTINVVTGLAK